ncbi:MAG: glycosyltransferase family 4 protein [Gemmatimonadaceae bacterium]
MTGAPWHLITGEYPPQPGGVSDYAAVLAGALAAAGCDVHVWAPEVDGPDDDRRGVRVHRLPGGFTETGLQALTTGLEPFPGPRTILVQYVAQAFGAHGMNVGFCRWVQHRARAYRDDVRVMFHEPYYPFTLWPLHHNLLALVNRMMAVLLLSDIRVAYVSTEAWQRRLRRYAPRARTFIWLPIASSVPRATDQRRVAEWRTWLAPDPGAHVVGHFGTYGMLVARLLEPALAYLLAQRGNLRVCLIGAGGEALAGRLCAANPAWRARVTVTETLAADEVAACLGACDVVLQPYQDGASGRRTTLMAPLRNGVPVVTNRGSATEPEWESSQAVEFADRAQPRALGDAVVRLLDDPERRRRIGAAGAELYARRFDITHSVDALLSPRSRSQAP